MSYKELEYFMNELLESTGVYRDEEIEIEKLDKYENKKKYKVKCSKTLEKWLSEEFKFDAKEGHKHKEIVELIEEIEAYYGVEADEYYCDGMLWNRKKYYYNSNRFGYNSRGYGGYWYDD